MATVIVGAGNNYRRDDGAGLATVMRLRRALPVPSADVRVLAKEGDFASLLDDWQGAEAVVVVDATSSGSAPGTIRRYDAREGPLPAAFSRSSTHAFGAAEAIELARAGTASRASRRVRRRGARLQARRGTVP